MTSEEFIVEINKDIDDENESAEKYNKIAKAFEDADQPNIAQIYKDIACEEALHAKHLGFVSKLLIEYPITDINYTTSTVTATAVASSPVVKQMEPITTH